MGTLTTVTATSIQDTAGRTLGSGKVRFFGPINQAGKTISSSIEGRPIICGEIEMLVSAGEITTLSDGGDPQVVDTSATDPVNVGYRVRILDESDNEVQGPGYEFVQPRGASWALAPAPQPGLATLEAVSFAIGVVTTGAPGTSASATNVGTPTEAVINFTVPAGRDGATNPNFEAPISVPEIVLAGSYKLVSAPAFGIDAEWAITDDNDRAILTIHSDGSIKMWGALAAMAGLSVTGPVSLSQASISDLIVGESETTTAVKPGGFSFPVAITGPADDLLISIASNGQVALYAPLLTPSGLIGPTRNGGCVDGDGWRYFTDKDAAGFWQIFSARDSVTHQLTDGAANSWGPTLAQGEARINFLSDRKMLPTDAYAVTEYTMTVGGCSQFPRSFDAHASLRNDIVCIQGNGQSLSQGANSGPPITTTQYGKNVTLQGGPVLVVPNPASLVPLIESYISGSGADQQAETVASSTANQFAFLCQKYKSFLPTIANTAIGTGGYDLAALFGSGPTPDPTVGSMANSMRQILAMKRLAGARAVQFAALTFVHGEADFSDGNTHYDTDLQTDLMKWHAIQAFGGVTSKPPMFLTQTASERPGIGSQILIAPQQARICMNNPGRFFMAGPEYVQQAFYDTGGLHMTAPGYQWLGMMLGAAIFRALVLGERQTGLLPIEAVRMTTTIRVAFRVPKPIGSSAAPSLVFDTSSLPASKVPGSFNGFEVRDVNGTLVTINSASIVADPAGNNTMVELVCASDPGAGGSVAYANTEPPTPAYGGGGTIGAWGNLRDNDTTPALYATTLGSALWNWCANFKLSYTS